MDGFGAIKKIIPIKRLELHWTSWRKFEPSSKS